MANMVKQYGWWAVGALVVVGGIGWFGWKVATSPTVPEADIVSKQGIHWHVKLDIRVKGELVPIPAGIGLGGGAPGLHPHRMHTHEPDHVIHVEKTGLVVQDDLRLKNFFDVWGEQFTSQCILKNCNGAEGTVKFMVNGQPNSEFENYRLQDGDVVEIGFE